MPARGAAAGRGAWADAPAPAEGAPCLAAPACKGGAVGLSGRRWLSGAVCAFVCAFSKQAVCVCRGLQMWTCARVAVCAGPARRRLRGVCERVGREVAWCGRCARLLEPSPWLTAEAEGIEEGADQLRVDD
eukprot:2898188-Prymnesium_polylepis.1